MSAGPRVLISYSHDSDEHDERVLALAQDLRRDGIDAWIDRFDPAPPQGWPTWMHEQVASPQFVVLVCTPTYRRRFDQQEQPGVGRGVSWEAMLVEQLRYEGKLDHETLVPVDFEGEVDEIVPLVVRSATNHAMPRDYAKLVDRLTRKFAVAPVPLGCRKNRARVILSPPCTRFASG